MKVNDYHMKCLNVIALYENANEVEQYIKSVSAAADDMVDVIVVVNSDKERQVEGLKKSLDDQGITCYSVRDYGENLGYLNAMLRTVRETDPEAYDYVILSNTDIQFPTDTFFTDLAKKEYPRDIGCIAPSVYSTTSDYYQNPHYLERIPRSKFERLIRIFRYPALAKLYLKMAGIKSNATKQGKKDSCYVYSPNGAYMIYTRDFIRVIRGYEYGVVLYSEESCIGELLRQHNMKCYYDSTLEVNHTESTVTGKINYKKRFKAWRESMIYIVNTFYEKDGQ